MIRSWLLVLAGVSVLAGCMTVERELLYRRTSCKSAATKSPCAREEVELQTADGTPIHARWYPREGSQGALLYCHGNAGNLADREQIIIDLLNYVGESVLIFDYPGYGRSGGTPTETGCYAAADAAYSWLVTNQSIAPERIVLFGKSLGGGVAVELATRRPHRALVLVKTFTSIPDMANEVLPLLPVGWLVHNRFDSLEKIGQVPGPVLIAHGDADKLVPIAQAKRLYAAAHDPKRFYVMEGCDHNDALTLPFHFAVADFLKKDAPLRAADRLSYLGTRIGPPP